MGSRTRRLLGCSALLFSDEWLRSLRFGLRSMVCRVAVAFSAGGLEGLRPSWFTYVGRCRPHSWPTPSHIEEFRGRLHLPRAPSAYAFQLAIA
jgi:hypothetical protein